MLTYKKIISRLLDQNIYILSNDNKEAVIIDPGLGFDLIDVRNKFGGIFIVRKISIKYSNFAHLEDMLTMNLQVEAAKKSIIILHAKIRVNNIEILRANMSLAFYNPESMKTQSLPDEIIKKIMEEF